MVIFDCEFGEMSEVILLLVRDGYACRWVETSAGRGDIEITKAVQDG